MPGRRAKAKSNVEQVGEQTKSRGFYYTDNEAAWGGFINIRLDDEQKQAFYAWLGDAGQAVSQLTDDALGEGVKVGLAFDHPNSCYIVTYTGALVLKSNERYVSTSRAATLPEALGLAAWKHFILCNGDYGNYKPRDSSFLSWG